MCVSWAWSGEGGLKLENNSYIMTKQTMYAKLQAYKCNNLVAHRISRSSWILVYFKMSGTNKRLWLIYFHYLINTFIHGSLIWKVTLQREVCIFFYFHPFITYKLHRKFNNACVILQYIAEPFCFSIWSLKIYIWWICLCFAWEKSFLQNFCS